eukprot:m.179493 g.179493  ORF g.179493 m.179493 type:complete len:97 (+) comp39219_c0_seq2:872-1162(+)
MVRLAGTKSFVAPEVLKGRCSHKSDIFSLGLTFACIAEVQCEVTESGQYLAEIVTGSHENWSMYCNSAGSLIVYKNAVLQERWTHHVILSPKLLRI